MKKQITFLVLILTMVMIVAGCEKQQPKSDNNQAIVNSQGMTQENEDVSLINIAEWQTYINESYNYSIKYPNDWDAYVVKSSGNWTPLQNQLIRIVPGENIEKLENTYLYYAPFSITVLDLQEVSEKTYNDIINSSKIYNNNLTFYKISKYNSNPMYSVITDDYLYQFNLIDGFTDKEKGEEIMEKIVLTFQVLK